MNYYNYYQVMYTKVNLLFLVSLIPIACLCHLNLKSCQKDTTELAQIPEIKLKELKVNIVRSSNEKAPKTPYTGCVILFAKCKFKGSWVQICESKEDLSQVNFSKKIASIKLGKGVAVSLFTGLKFEGKMKQLRLKKKCIKTLGKKMMSLKIQPKGQKFEVFNDQVIAPTKPKRGCAFVFEECGFKGRWARVCSSTEDLSKIEFAKKISSMKVGKETKVELYSEREYHGTGLKFMDQDIRCMREQKFDKQAESLKLFQEKRKLHKVNIYNSKIPAPKQPANGCALLFESCEYKGRWSHVCRNLNSFKKFNFQVSSIKLGLNTKAILFTKDKYKGHRLVIKTASFSCIKENSPSSLKLKKIKQKESFSTFPPHIQYHKKVKKGCIQIFEKCGYQGKWAMICKRIDNLNRIAFNNQIKSIRLGRGSYVKLWSQGKFQGKGKRFKKHKRCLENSEYGKMVNSLKVFRLKKKNNKKALRRRAKTLKVFKAGKKLKKLRKNCILVYEKCHFKGSFARICKNIKNFKPFNFGENISSIKFGSNINQITLFQEKKYQGGEFLVYGERDCLEEEEFEGSALSIQLYKNSSRKKSKDEKNMKQRKKKEIKDEEDHSYE